MKQLKILSIGNDSWRIAMSYLPKIAKCDSVSVVSGILYADVQTPDALVQKIISNSDDFTFEYNNEGSVRFNTIKNFSAVKAFDWFDWDFVVIQQDNDFSEENVAEICDFVRENSPEITVLINNATKNSGMPVCNTGMTFSVSEISADAEKEIAQSGFIADLNTGRVKDFLSACILYEMLTGNNVAKNKYRLPFVESEITEIIKNVVHRYYSKG